MATDTGYTQDTLMFGEGTPVRVVRKEGEIYFCATDVGTAFGIKDIRHVIMDYGDKYRTKFRTETTQGVHSLLFLTERGLYRFIMRSNKPMAEPFQDWICEIVETHRRRYELDLAAELRALHEKGLALQAEYDRMRQRQVLEESPATHDTLMRVYTQRQRVKLPLVYVAHMGLVDDAVLIKFGSTEDIVQRAQDLRNQFGTVYMIRTYETAAFREFERYIHDHPDLAAYKYREPLFKNHASEEVYRVPQSTLAALLDMVEESYATYTDIQTYPPLPPTLSAAPAIETKEAPDAETKPAAPPRKAHRAQKVQQYTPDGTRFLRTFANMTDVFREFTQDTMSRPALQDAVEKRTLYKGYRWAFIERTDPDDLQRDIGPTVETRPANTGLVAMLNHAKTEIVRVFGNQKEAAAYMGHTSTSAVSKSVRAGTVSGGHFFVLYETVADELKEAYLAKHELPQAPVARTVGRAIDQLDPQTRAVVHTFTTITDVIKAVPMNRDAFKRAIDDNTLFKGFYWRYSAPAQQ